MWTEPRSFRPPHTRKKQGDRFEASFKMSGNTLVVITSVDELMNTETDTNYARNPAAVRSNLVSDCNPVK